MLFEEEHFYVIIVVHIIQLQIRIPRQKNAMTFLINTSCPKINNPDASVIVNKIVNQHNHELNCDLIKFEESKRFTPLMIEDIKFMTMSCKFGATARRKFLEGKYPTHSIYPKDLYAAIQKF